MSPALVALHRKKLRKKKKDGLWFRSGQSELCEYGR
jgi:hypothetical protein